MSEANFTPTEPILVEAPINESMETEPIEPAPVDKPAAPAAKVAPKSEATAGPTTQTGSAALPGSSWLSVLRMGGCSPGGYLRLGPELGVSVRHLLCVVTAIAWSRRGRGSCDEVHPVLCRSRGCMFGG